MTDRSIFSTFSDGTVAAVRRMSINDNYSGLLEGTRTAYSKYLIEEIHEKMRINESSVRKGQPNGKYIVEPELVPEMWGNILEGNCFKEYEVTTHYQVCDKDDMLDLDVIFYASKEDIEQLTKVLASVTEKIDFTKYSKRTSIEDWI